MVILYVYIKMNKKEIIDYLLENKFEILLGNDDFNDFIMGEVYAEKEFNFGSSNIFFIKLHKYNANGFLGKKPYICDYKKEFKWSIKNECKDFIIIRLFNFNTDEYEYEKILYDGYTINDISITLIYIENMITKLSGFEYIKNK